MLDQALLAREFPFLAGEVFLNSSYITVPPVRTQRAYAKFMEDLVASYADDFLRIASVTTEQARRRIADLIGAHPEEIAFVKNTTEGIGIFAQGLDYRPGDNVVTIDQEHSANLFAWIKLQRQGVGLRVVQSRANAVQLADIASQMDAHTRAVAVSAVEFSTGFAVELEALGALCAERGALLVVDGIQALGRMEIDVERMNIAYLASGGNKGLFGILGAGFAYCRLDVIKRLTPPYASYQSTVNEHKPPAVTTDFSQLYWRDDAGRLESGNLNHAGIAALGAGVSLVLELGVTEIQRHILSLEKDLRRRLDGIGLRVVTAGGEQNRSGVVCVYYPQQKEDEVAALLRRRHIHTTMRGGYIRMSLHAFNTETDVEQAAEALWEIARL